MEKCRRLEEYAVFVDTIRRYKKEYAGMDEAVNLAVNECIDKGILEDVLRNQRAEVVDMLLTTFDQEIYEKSIKEDSFEEGRLYGSIKTYIESCQEFFNSMDETVLRLMKKFSLEKQVAEEYVEKYWR